jgi:hypothetical protein
MDHDQPAFNPTSGITVTIDMLVSAFQVLEQQNLLHTQPAGAVAWWAEARAQANGTTTHPVRERITHDNTGRELTPEESEIYGAAMDITDATIALLTDKSVVCLQAVGFNLFETYMRAVSNGEDLRAVADVVERLANDMRVAAARRFGPPESAPGSLSQG